MSDISFEVGTANSSRGLVLGEGFGGKTYLVRSITKHIKRAIVITPNAEEFKDYPNRILTDDEERVLEGFDMAYEQGNLCLIFDDGDATIDRYMTDSRFKRVIVSGRHRGVAWIIVSRRTADIPVIVAKQANRVFLFQTDLPTDIKFYNDYFGTQPAEAVKGLNRERHEFYYWNKDDKASSGVMIA